MGALDAVVAGYLVLGFFKGRRRGLRAELVRVISLLIVLGFLLGFGLFKVVGQGISSLADAMHQPGGMFASSLVLIATLGVVFAIRRWLSRRQAPLKPAGEPASYGGIAGVLRSGLTLVLVLLIFKLLFPEMLNKTVFGNSLLGQMLDML